MFQLVFKTSNQLKWRHDTQHNYTKHKGVICDTHHKCQSTKMSFRKTALGHDAQCHIYVIMLNVVMLNVVMLNVVMLSAIMMNVVMLTVSSFCLHSI